MARRFFGGRKVRGLSTDTKPTAPEDDAEFYETNTKKTFDWSGSAWVERTTPEASAITANTAKTGITGAQATAITANTAKISLDDNSVTLSKLAHGTAGKLVGFNSSTGVPEEQDAPSGSVGNTVVLKHNTTIGDYTFPTLEDTAHSSVGTGTGNTTYVALTDTTTTVPLTDTYYATLWTSTANQADQDNSTSSQVYTVSGSSAYRDNGYAIWDFGDDAGYAIRICQRMDGIANGVAQWFHSDDNSSWTEITSAVPTETKTEADYAISGGFRYLKYYQNSASGWMTQHLFQVTRLRYGTTVDYTSRKMVDQDTGEYAVTNEEANPWLSAGMASSTLTSGVALWLESDTNETEIKIQTSPDNSTWTTKRTVLVSKLTAGQYNYIRFTPTTCQYIRIYGSSGASKKLAIGELKVKNGVTDALLLTDHEHLDISTTDTSLELDGTA
jgi:hypothetical protein